MDSHGIHVMTIANSIIGVSIIAMPYCFKQCGIILSIIMLIFSSIISRLSCHFLLKSAIRARLRTFEFLAYHAFGSLGKFIVEIGMIGFLLGTCIAFFVVMGDLGPEIVAQMLGIDNNYTLRSVILVSLAIFCVLPLGLLKNVDSLSGVSVATIGFYICLVLKIMAESASHIVSGDWFDNIEWWRTEGALQCTPIFSIALFCQTQLFEIYQAIPNASLEKMNALIRIAVNICTCVYIFVGIFGYIALSDKTFTGNVLLSLTPSFLTDIIKLGFVLSLAFSFPLIIFPCRASIFSLVYKPTYTMLHDGGTQFIPEAKFKMITIFIIATSLVIGILIPNIELVLGLVGSTIGVSICVLFPATCFICMLKKNTNERILAQMMLCIGIVVMVLGTYANLNAVDDVALGAVTQHSEFKLDIADIPKAEDKILISVSTTGKWNIPSVKLERNVASDDVVKEVRHEPPQPIAPVEQSEEVGGKVNKAEIIPPQQSQEELKEPELKEIRREPPQPIEPEHNVNEIKKDESRENEAVKANHNVPTINIPKDNVSLEKLSQSKAGGDANAVVDQVDVEAIKKEETEINKQAQEELQNVVQKLDLIGELQKQNQEQQQQILEQQKKIWEEMKQKKDPLQEQIQIDKVKQEKLKAMKEIGDIAKKAIESLVDDGSKILLDAKVIENVDEQAKLLKFESNPDSRNRNVSDDVKVNPARLSHQLPLNIPHNAANNSVVKTENSSSFAFIPLPIVKSGILAESGNRASYNLTVANVEKVNVSNVQHKNVILLENKTGPESNQTAQNSSNTISKKTRIQDTQKLIDEKNLDDKKQNDELEEIKSMRRDILSEHKNDMRNKRDLFDSRIREEISNSNGASIVLNSLKTFNEAEDSKNKKNCDKP